MKYPYRSQWAADALQFRQDCGPACVSMVLGGFGQDVPVNVISAEEMNADTGTDAGDLIASLVKRGIKAVKWTGSGYPAFPAICLVRYSGFKRTSVQDVNFLGWHWLIVLSLTATEAIVHDPDWWGARMNEGANKHYTRAEFDAAFLPYGVTRIAVTWEEALPVTTPTAGIVTSDMPFLRLRATAGGTVIGVVKNGTPVSIIGQGNAPNGQKWYQVEFKVAYSNVYKNETMTIPFDAPTLTGWVYAGLVTVASDPPPVPPPVVTRKVKLGVNCVNPVGDGVDLALANEAPVITRTFDPDHARVLKQAHPELIVMCRPNLYKGHIPSLDSWRNMVESSWCDGMFVSGLNEGDQSPQDAAHLKERIAFDTAALNLIKTEGAKRNIRMYYVGGSLSVGENNIVIDDECKAMFGYAPLMKDPQYRFNYHTYSANDGATDNGMNDIRDRIFKTDYIDVPSRRWDGANWTNFTERIYRTDWTITRWRFFYRRCGWNPNWPGRIVSDETGLEVGSYGSFPAVPGCDDAYMQRWARRYVELQAQQIKVLDAMYDSPFDWGAFFQCGATGSWQTYDMRSRLPALKACGWGQA